MTTNDELEFWKAECERLAEALDTYVSKDNEQAKAILYAHRERVAERSGV